MFRNILGSLLALLGAAAVVHSPFHLWYGGRPGREFGLAELFSADGISADRPAPFSGLLLPMLVTAVITVVAVLLRSRILVTLAGLIALGFTVLWMVRQGQAAGSLTAGNNGLGIGVAEAGGGALVLLLGAVVMRGRRPRRRRRSQETDRARHDERYEPPPPHEQQYGRGAYETAEPYPEPGPQPPVRWAGLGQQQDRDGGMGGMEGTRAIGGVHPEDEPRPESSPAQQQDMDRTQIIGPVRAPGGSHDAAREPGPGRGREEPRPEAEQEPPATPESGDTQPIPRTPPDPRDRS